MGQPISRRTALARLAGSAAAVSSLSVLNNRLDAAAEPGRSPLNYRIKHSVCRWCYNKIPLDDLCRASREIGLQSVELVNPSDFPVLRKHGLTCAMVSNPVVDGLGGIARAFNRREHHDPLVEAYQKRIGETADAGMPNLICFSGNRAGLADEEGLENCAAGLKRIMRTAESRRVTVAMELLNSKINHKDYQAHRTAWGVELCRRVESERFKLLYDIYHMQVMEGDVIATIRSFHPYIAHYHTGGVPGRHEIDQTQELNYPAIMRAIVETGFAGFVGQEFIPARPDPLASLEQGVRICDV